MKLVINTCFGGFCLSKAAYDHMGIPCALTTFGDAYPIDGHEDPERDDPRLIAAAHQPVTVPDSWKEFRDGEYIWAYIPVALVRDFLEAHGGVQYGPGIPIH